MGVEEIGNREREGNRLHRIHTHRRERTGVDQRVEDDGGDGWSVLGARWGVKLLAAMMAVREVG